MNKKYIISLTLAIIIFALINGPATFAADTTDTVTVTINISSVGTIVVNPTSVSWTEVNPGADTSKTNVVIKNKGSANVSNVYITSSAITDEATNPLPTANTSKYSAPGLVLVRNSTETDYYHVGRLEWNLSAELSEEVLDLAAGTTNFSHGWYRNASGNEYIWKVENGTDGKCNDTGTIFIISEIPENDTDMSRDHTADPSDCGAVTVGTTWGTFACVDGPLTGHCVATSVNCDRIYIYKNDYSTTFPACTNRDYLRAANLIPGSEFSISIFASIPYGMPAGNTTTGTLTISGTY